MPKIKFIKEIAAISCQNGEVLMTALLAGGQPVASSCNGQGICSKCRVEIITGAKNLSPESLAETALREQNKIQDNFRISCQTKVLGDIVIDAPYW